MFSPKQNQEADKVWRKSNLGNDTASRSFQKQACLWGSLLWNAFPQMSASLVFTHKCRNIFSNQTWYKDFLLPCCLACTCANHCETTIVWKRPHITSLCKAGRPGGFESLCCITKALTLRYVTQQPWKLPKLPHLSELPILSSNLSSA